MSLSAVVQHLAVLEDSGLVSSRKVGRVRTCRIEPAALRGAEDWVAQRRAVWEAARSAGRVPRRTAPGPEQAAGDPHATNPAGGAGNQNQNKETLG